MSKESDARKELGPFVEDLVSELDDHGLAEMTCGHIGFVDEAGPKGECVNCAAEAER